MDKSINNVQELFVSSWKLLNETTVFLSGTNIFTRYEKKLCNWRNQLTKFPENEQTYKKIKNKLIELRRKLRNEGYDLHSASRNIVINGYKNDNAPSDGYKRLVIFITDQNIYYLAGSDTHAQLAKYLGLKLGIENLKTKPSVHNLWFRWNNNILELCGADSETVDNMEHLRSYLESHKIHMIKKLKGVA